MKILSAGIKELRDFKMKTKHFLFSILLLTLILVSCDNSSNSKNLSLEEKLDKSVSRYVKKWNYKPAISVSVFSKDKQIDFDYAGGFASVSLGINFSYSENEKKYYFKSNFDYKVLSFYEDSLWINILQSVISE